MLRGHSENSGDFIDNNIIVNGRVGVILRKLEPLLKPCKHKQRAKITTIEARQTKVGKTSYG